MMGIVMLEKCWSYKKYNKISSGIYLVFLFFSYRNDARSNIHQMPTRVCPQKYLELFQNVHRKVYVNKSLRIPHLLFHFHFHTVNNINTVNWRRNNFTKFNVSLSLTNKMPTPNIQTYKNTVLFLWFQASTAKQIRTALFWVITQRVVIIYYRPFGTTVGPIFKGQNGTDNCSETSVRNDHYSLRNNPEERSSHKLLLFFVFYCGPDTGRQKTL